MSRLKRHVRNYTQVGNDIINAKNLSLKSKGLFLFLLSKPDNWNFSARLIATQNKDAIAAVNSGLQELEDFGLLHRVPVQGGYDYEIFDTVQSHLVENRLSGKSVKRRSKIHLVENQPSISNTIPLAKREERENIIIPSSIDLNPYHVKLFLDNVCSSRSVKNKTSYRASLLFSLMTENDKNHSKTLMAFNDFVSNLDLTKLSVLPDGFDMFDLISQMYPEEVKHV